MVGQVVVISYHSVYVGFHVCSLRLSQSQLDALSAALARAFTEDLRVFPLIPIAPIIFHTDCDGNPVHPTSTGKIHVFQPLSLQVLARSSYFAFFGLICLIYSFLPWHGVNGTGLNIEYVSVSEP